MNLTSRTIPIRLPSAWLRSSALAVALVSLGFHVEASELRLTADEQRYLTDNPVIDMCVDPDWRPYEILDGQGRHVGIVAEYMTLFQQRLGVSLKPVPVKTWADSQQLYRQGYCDIVSALNQTSERTQYLDFSEPYLESPAVLVVGPHEYRISSLEDMRGRTLAMVKGYVYESSLRRDYPAIRLIHVANMQEGLRQVSTGKIDATLGPLFLIAASVQSPGLEDLKILGSTPYRDELRVGVRKGDLVLLGLMNKAVRGLTRNDHAEARRRGLEQTREATDGVSPGRAQ